MRLTTSVPAAPGVEAMKEAEQRVQVHVYYIIYFILYYKEIPKSFLKYHLMISHTNVTIYGRATFCDFYVVSCSMRFETFFPSF